MVNFYLHCNLKVRPYSKMIYSRPTHWGASWMVRLARFHPDFNVDDFHHITQPVFLFDCQFFSLSILGSLVLPTLLLILLIIWIVGRIGKKNKDPFWRRIKKIKRFYKFQGQLHNPMIILRVSNSSFLFNFYIFSFTVLYWW